MKNTTIIVFIGLIVLLAGSFVFFENSSEKIIAVEPEIIDGVAQQVVLSMKDYNYYPQEVRVKANQPVEITLDESVYGCLRSFTIPELGVVKYAQSPEDKIIFIPTEIGRYKAMCSMAMGYMDIVVE